LIEGRSNQNKKNKKMKSVSISGSPRANVGKTDAKALRSAKQVPCVLYGGKEQIHFSVLETEFKNLIYTPNVHTVDLEIAGNKYNAILQEAQFHKISDNLIHVDFLELKPGKPVTMNIPVRTTGTSPGVRNGGRLVKKLKSIRAKGLVEKMPDEITIAIDTMEIGHSVRIEDIKIDGLTFLNAAKTSVISVETMRAVIEEAKTVAPVTAGAVATPAAGATSVPAKGAPAATTAKVAAKTSDKK
jgi:large subunit ribosomal protein L25